MPIYEFYCEKCGKIVEEIQGINDPVPICEQDNIIMKKILSCFKTRKGAGVYSIDSPSVPILKDE